MSKDKIFSNGRIIGIILIILSIVIYKIKPSLDCSWWNAICHMGNILLFPLQIVFILISLILLIVGVVKLIKG